MSHDDFVFERFVIELEAGDTGYQARSGPEVESLGDWIEPNRQSQTGSTGSKPAVTREIRRRQVMDLPWLKEIGNRLFEWIFVGGIRDSFVRALAQISREGRGLALWIQLDRAPGLASLPWEALRDPKKGDFLESSNRIVIVRTLAHVSSIRPATSRTLNLWGLLPDPPGETKLSVQQEWEQICDQLKSLAKRKYLVLEKCPKAALESLGEQLEGGRCHVLHVAAHGEASQKRQEMGRLILEHSDGKRSKKVTGADLAAVLTRDPNQIPHLVVLNVCFGAQSRKDEIYDGLAQHLLRRGVPAVVAMRTAISDQAAIEFSKAFYSTLAKGLTIEAAMNHARHVLYRGDNKREWCTPVLYLATDQIRLVPPRRTPFGVKVAVVVGFNILGLAAWWHFSTENPMQVVDPCAAPKSLLSLKMVEIEPKLVIQDGGEVSVQPGFCIGAYEVTRGQWFDVMGEYPEDDERWADELRTDQTPITRVKIEDAEQFLDRLTRGPGNGTYRLPRESEWKYAASAGSTDAYFFGNDPKQLHIYGNCRNLFGRDTWDGPAPVGSYKPNKWGLYDVHGNVAEWVATPVADDLVTVDDGRARRMGGSYDNASEKCTLSFSHKRVIREDRRPETGFRVLRELPPSGEDD